MAGHRGQMLRLRIASLHVAFFSAFFIQLATTVGHGGALLAVKFHVELPLACLRVRNFKAGDVNLNMKNELLTIGKVLGRIVEKNDAPLVAISCLVHDLNLKLGIRKLVNWLFKHLG